MLKQDRFLMGILVFIAVLVLAAVALFFARNEKPNYGREDTPEGVLYNYAVALQLHDYERAYTYLADNPNKPTYEAFHQAFLTRQIDPGNSSLQIGDMQTLSSGEVWVNITVQNAGNGLFDSGWSNNDKGTLINQNGAWKITYLANPYWVWDWYQPTPVPAK
jgi:hypothetical protein